MNNIELWKLFMNNNYSFINKKIILDTGSI